MAKSVLSDNPVRFVRCKVCLIRHGFGEKKLIVPTWRRADLKDLPAIKNRGLPRSFLNNLGFCGSVLRFCLSYTPAFFKAAPTIS